MILLCRDEGMASIVARVFSRHVLAKQVKVAASIGIGRSFQNEIVRIHRYSDVLEVTDITNAGKRGKKADQFTVQLSYAYKGDQNAWFERTSDSFVDLAQRGLPAMRAYIKDLMHDFPGEIRVEERQIKAILVEPYGDKFEFRIPREGGGHIEVRSSPIDFVVIDRWPIRDPVSGEPTKDYMDTGYHPIKRDDAAAFYAWVKDNHDKAKRTMNRMDLFRELWRHLAVNVRSH